MNQLSLCGLVNVTRVLMEPVISNLMKCLGFSRRWIWRLILMVCDVVYANKKLPTFWRKPDVPILRVYHEDGRSGFLLKLTFFQTTRRHIPEDSDFFQVYKLFLLSHSSWEICLTILRNTAAFSRSGYIWSCNILVFLDSYLVRRFVYM